MNTPPSFCSTPPLAGCRTYRPLVRRFFSIRWLALGSGLLLGGPSALAQAPTLINRSPVRNAVAAPRAANVALTFSQPLAGASAGNVRVFRQQRGGQLVRGGNATLSGNTLTVDPATDFKPGETVMVTVPPTVLGANGQAAAPHVYQFTAAVGGTGTGTFNGGSDFSVGISPISVALGDVDTDGDLDVLTANVASGVNTVSVRLNDGAGTFSGATEVGVGRGPESVAVGDVDGDGNLDLLTTSRGQGLVSVRLNNGSGAFSGTTDVPVGNGSLSGPVSVVVGDVDGDGDLDLLTANNHANSVSVRLNAGNGTFTGSHNVPVGSGVYGVAIGDVDADGDLDVLTANFLANTASVRLNDGTGIFSGTQDVPVGLGAENITVGDVDGDGDLDLLTANYGTNTVSVRLNDGTGTFSGTTDVPVDAAPASVALGDVDGDGDLDLLAANAGANTVSVRLNDGLGSFSGNTDVGAGIGSVSVAVGDVDSDGDLDLITANNIDNTVGVRLNNPVLSTHPAHETATAFTLAPNPTRGAVRLTGAPAYQLLTLLDATGRRVRTLQADAEGAASLPAGALAPGLYLLRAADGRTARLVVE